MRVLLEGEGPARDHAARQALADAALMAACDGSRPRDDVRGLALRALSDPAEEDAGIVVAAGRALCFCDCFGELDASLARLDGDLGTAVDGLIAMAEFRRGRLERAQPALAAAVARAGTPEAAEELTAALATCAFELGQSDDPEVDLEALLAKGRRLAARGQTNPACSDWRSDAAMLALRLGDPSMARDLAAAELELARAFGAPRALGIALRSTGLALGGESGLARLAESVAVLEGTGAELELARSQVELGAFLRRSGERQNGRDTLRAGLDLAERLGAARLAERADVELRATGARPRRAVLSGVQSLTASELRVAELAAAGRSNREIAQELFVTMRTVTTHLTHVYQKLEIAGRDDIAPLLASAEADSPTAAAASRRPEAIAVAAGPAVHRDAGERPNVSDAVAALSAPARALVQMLALCGQVEPPSSEHLLLARQLADLDAAGLDRARAELRSSELPELAAIGQEGAVLSAPLGAEIYGALPEAPRSRGHVRAAGLLQARLNGVRLAGGHLARVPPAGDPDTVTALRAAAGEAISARAVPEARDRLVRALAEPPAAEQLAAVAAELGTVESILRDPAAETHLAAAAGDPVADTVRCGVQLLGGRLAAAHRLVQETAEAFGTDVAPEVLAPVETARALLALLDRRYMSELEPRVGLISMLSVAAGPPGWSLQLIDGFWRWLQTGSAPSSLRQIERSFEALLADPASLGDLAGIVALAQIVSVDDRVGAERTIGALFTAASRSGSVASALLALGWSSHLQLRTGNAGVALGDAEAARRLADGLDVGAIAPWLAAFHADALVERGDPDGAFAVLESVTLDGLEHSVPAAYAWFSRGRVELARERPRAAAAALRRCRAVSAGLFVDNPNVLASRSLLARAIADEAPAEARALLNEELALARRLRQPRAIGTALHGLAVLDRDAAGLSTAAATLSRAPAPVSQAHALGELGQIRLDQRDRDGALEALTQALEIALSHGATALCDTLATRLGSLR